MTTGRLRPTAPPRSEMSADERVDLIGARVHIDVVIPRTQVAGKMRLISRREKHAIRAEVRKLLADAGFPTDGTAIAALGAHAEWSSEVAVRTLQKAIRDPKDPDRELATIEDWRECDDDQLGALVKRYEDLEAELDPLGAEVDISAAELAQLVDAAKKKDVDSLLSFGSLKLARFAISSVLLQSMSATPTSSSGLSPDVKH